MTEIRQTTIEVMEMWARKKFGGIEKNTSKGKYDYHFLIGSFDECHMINS